MNEKQIVVFGGGAIGSAVAGYLSQAQRNVALVDPWFLHVETIREQGLRVTAPEGEFVAPVTAFHIDELERLPRPADIAILAIKSYDTEWVTRLLIPYLSPEGFIVSAQNGLNEDRIASIAGAGRTVGCVVTLGGVVEEPGHMIRTSRRDSGSFHVGELDKAVTPRIEELAELLQAVGPAEVSRDIWSQLWSKLTVNCMSNAISGLTGMSAGEWRLDPAAQRVGVRIGAEVVAVAAALGYTVAALPGGLDPQTLIATARGDSDEAYVRLERYARERFSGATEGRPSLLQDVRKGRRTEVRYLNGAVVERGERVGVDVSANRAVMELIEEIERGKLVSDRRNLERLREYAQ